MHGERKFSATETRHSVISKIHLQIFSAANIHIHAQVIILPHKRNLYKYPSI